MNSKTTGWILTIFPIVGLACWALSPIFALGPPAEFEGGYGAFAAELGKSANAVSLWMALAGLAYAVLTVGLMSLKSKYTDGNYGYMAGILLLVGFAGQGVETGAFSAAAQAASKGAEMIPSAAALIVFCTTAGGGATSIFALGLALLGAGLYMKKSVHVISSASYMIIGLFGVVGSILFYDGGLMTVYYFGLTLTTIAVGIELIRTGQD